MSKDDCVILICYLNRTLKREEFPFTFTTRPADPFPKSDLFLATKFRAGLATLSWASVILTEMGSKILQWDRPMKTEGVAQCEFLPDDQIWQIFKVQSKLLDQNLEENLRCMNHSVIRFQFLEACRSRFSFSASFERKKLIR